MKNGCIVSFRFLLFNAHLLFLVGKHGISNTFTSLDISAIMRTAQTQTWRSWTRTTMEIDIVCGLLCSRKLIQHRSSIQLLVLSKENIAHTSSVDHLASLSQNAYRWQTSPKLAPQCLAFSLFRTRLKLVGCCTLPCTFYLHGKYHLLVEEESTTPDELRNAIWHKYAHVLFLTYQRTHCPKPPPPLIYTYCLKLLTFRSLHCLSEILPTLWTWLGRERKTKTERG